MSVIPENKIEDEATARQLNNTILSSFLNDCAKRTMRDGGIPAALTAQSMRAAVSKSSLSSGRYSTAKSINVIAHCENELFTSCIGVKHAAVVK